MTADKWSNLKIGGDVTSISKTRPTFDDVEERKYNSTQPILVSYAGMKVLMRNKRKEE